MYWNAAMERGEIVNREMEMAAMQGPRNLSRVLRVDRAVNASAR